MALIEITPDLKRATKELRRIADALEAYLLLQFSYRTQPPSKSELEGEPADVDYSSDEATLKRELEDAKREIEHADDEAGLVK